MNIATAIFLHFQQIIKLFVTADQTVTSGLSLNSLFSSPFPLPTNLNSVEILNGDFPHMLMEFWVKIPEKIYIGKIIGIQKILLKSRKILKSDPIP